MRTSITTSSLFPTQISLEAPGSYFYSLGASEFNQNWWAYGLNYTNLFNLVLLTLLKQGQYVISASVKQQIEKDLSSIILKRYLLETFRSWVPTPLLYNMAPGNFNLVLTEVLAGGRLLD